MPRAPDWQNHQKVREWATGPPNGASTEEFFDYWSAGRDHSPERAQARLLSIAQDKEWFLRVVPLLDESDRVFAMADSWLKSRPKAEQAAALALLPYWIKERSRFPELLAAVRQDSTAFERAEALKTLAYADWKAARAIVMQYTRDEAIEVRAVALTLVMTLDHDSGGSGHQAIRRELLRIVSGRAASDAIRNSAAHSLLRASWSGKRDWYLSLFGDSTLRPALVWPLWEDPQTWIPLVLPLLRQANAVVHDSAAFALATVAAKHENAATPELLTALAPWIADPNWAAAGQSNALSLRRSLVLRLETVLVPAAVPALLTAVSETELAADAITALGHQADPRAVEILRTRWQRDRELGALEALARCGGATTQDQVSTVERAAKGRGQYPILPPDDRVAIALFKRSREVASSDPRASRNMFQYACRWRTPAVSDELVRRLETGETSLETILYVLRRAGLLRSHPGIARLATKGRGAARGIAASVIGNSDALADTDVEARQALLAGSRWLGSSLPIARLGESLVRDPGATGAYLEFDTRPAAHEVLWKRYPRECRIVGWRGGPETDFERSLRSTMRDRGPLELHALVRHDQRGRTILVEVHKDRIRITDTQLGRTRTGSVEQKEWNKTRKFLVSNEIATLLASGESGSSGSHYKYLHLRAEGGRRLKFDDLGGRWPQSALYLMLVRRFERLADTMREK